MYETEAKNIYVDISKNKEIFDVSNYSTKLKYYNDSNELVTGKKKDETGGDATEEFVWLEAKVDLIQLSHSSEYQKAKGVNKNLVA